MRATAANCFASPASQIRLPPLRQSNPTGKSPKVCPSLHAKIFRLRRRANQRYQLAPSHPIRGALRTSRTLRWDAVDAMTASDERLTSRTAKSCGPGAPTLASSFWETSFSGVTVAKEPGHRGERGVSRKPLRRESRRCSGSPVVLPPCFFCCTGPMGAIGTRLSLRPLLHERVKNDSKLGHVVPRGCRLASSSLFEM
jgi:hypothetical protein